MTEKPHSWTTADRIDRRTLLSGFAGGVAAVAGCSDSSGSTTPTGTEPSEDSELIESISYRTSQYGALWADIRLIEDSGVEKINLITAEGKEQDSARLSTGETVAELNLTGPGASGGISEEGNKLILVGEGLEKEISFSYSPTVEVKDFVRAVNNDNLTVAEKEDAAIVLKNPGEKPAVVVGVTSQYGPHMYDGADKKSVVRSADIPIKSGEIAPIRIGRYLSGYVECPEEKTREAKLTVELGLGDNIEFYQNIQYQDGDPTCDISLLNGSYERSEGEGES